MTKRTDLHEELRRPAFDHAVFCTYGFQPDFFEDYCLEKFESLYANNNITVLMDGQEFDQLLCGPPEARPRKANLRYLLHAVRPSRGRFHSKIALLSGPKKAALVIGSANLTRPGITRNAELVNVFRFERGKDERFSPLFESALAFLQEVESRWPSQALQTRLIDLATDAPWKHAGRKALPDQVRFQHNLAVPLLDECFADIRPDVDRVMILSPFFDETPAVLDKVIARLKPRRVEIYTENGATTMTAAWTRHPALRAKDALRFCTWRDNTHQQSLHAKAIAVVRGSKVRLAVGSANFTRAGLLSTQRNGNVETLLITDCELKAAELGALFDPCGTAHSDTLRTASRTARKPTDAPTLSLREATLDDGRVTCVIDGTPPEAPVLILSFADGGERRVALKSRGDGWGADLDEDLQRRCDQSAAVLYIEGRIGATIARSGLVLLVNLKDAATGISSPQDRRIREAQRSAEHFASALLNLIASGTEGALKDFLTYCDIPLSTSSGPLGRLRPRDAVATVQETLRELGPRNIREYADLHEAAVEFCERHLRRLERYTASPSFDMAGSAMHLARAVANVLFTQCERLVSGLEVGLVLNAKDWFEHRQRLDKYLILFRDLVKLTDMGLRRLRAAYPRDEVQAAVREDFPPLREVRELLFRVEERIRSAVVTKLKVRNDRGVLVAPMIKDNVISPRKWLEWQEDVALSSVWLNRPEDPPFKTREQRRQEWL